MNTYQIPVEEYDNVMTSFWMMLRECENTADNNNDPVLKHWVTGWYQQWNSITGEQHVPTWARRADSPTA